MSEHTPSNDQSDHHGHDLRADTNADAKAEALQPQALQHAIRERALATIERRKAVKRRPPLQVAIISIVVLTMVGVFWVTVDFGVRSTHQIIDIWLPVLLKSNKASNKAPATPQQPYMISVEPEATSASSVSTPTDHTVSSSAASPQH